MEVSPKPVTPLKVETTAPSATIFESPGLSPIHPRGFQGQSVPSHFLFQKIEEEPFTPRLDEDEQHCHSAGEDDRHGIAASSFDDALDWYLSDKGNTDIFEQERVRSTIGIKKNSHRRNLSFDQSPSPLRRTCYSSKSKFFSPLSALNEGQELDLGALTPEQRAHLANKLSEYENRVENCIQKLNDWDLAKIVDMYSDTDSTLSEQSIDLEAFGAEVNEAQLEAKIQAQMKILLDTQEFVFQEEPIYDDEVNLSLDSIILSKETEAGTTPQELSQQRLSSNQSLREDRSIALMSPTSPKQFIQEGKEEEKDSQEQNMTTYTAFVKGIEEEKKDTGTKTPRLSQDKITLEDQVLSKIVSDVNGQDQDEIKDFLKSFVLHDSPVRFSKIAKPILRETIAGEETPEKRLERVGWVVVDGGEIERSQTNDSQIFDDLDSSFSQNAPPTEAWQGFMHSRRGIDPIQRTMSMEPAPFQRIAMPLAYSDTLLAKENFFMPSGEEQLRALMNSDPLGQIFILRSLTGMRRAINIFSDYELAHYRNISQQILDKEPLNQTANIILGQIDYCAMHYDGALAYFQTALDQSTIVVKKWFGKKKVIAKQGVALAEPALWKALTLFELYQEKQGIRQKKKLILECESTLIQAYKSDKRNLTTLWMLFQLSLLNETGPREHKQKLKFKASDYYHKIYSLDNYLGAVCWADLHYFLQKDLDKAAKALLELIHRHKGRVTAMLRLWHYFHASSDKNKQHRAVDISESLFFSTQKDQKNLAIKNIVAIMYAKSLFKTGDTEVCFRLLQSKFAQNPHLPLLLMYFAKFVIKSKERIGFGAAIGALQECLRSCIPERVPQIHYWLGRIYEEMGQVYHMMTHYSKAKVSTHLLSTKKVGKIRDIMDKHSTIIKLYNELNRQIKYKDKLSSHQVDQILSQLAGHCEFSAMFYEAQINLYLYDNPQKTEKLLIELDDISEDDVTAGLEYIRVLKKTNNWQLIDCFAYKLLKKTQNNILIPTDQWAKCVIWRAKSLFQRGRVKKALGVLKRLYSAFPQVPVTTTQNFAPDDPFASAEGDAVGSDKEEEEDEVNFDSAANQSGLLSMSVLQKIGPPMPRAETVSSNKSSDQDPYVRTERSQPSMYLKRILSNEQGGNDLEKQIKDAGLSLQELVDRGGSEQEETKNNELVRKCQLLDRLSIKIRDVRGWSTKTETPEYAKFTVYSDPTFLYYIGKFCAKSGMFLKEAKQALQDYMLLINSTLSPGRANSDMVSNEARAKFWYGIVLFKLHQIEQAEVVILRESIKALKEAKSALFTVALRKKYQVCEKMVSLLQTRKSG